MFGVRAEELKLLPTTDKDVEEADLEASDCNSNPDEDAIRFGNILPYITTASSVMIQGMQRGIKSTSQLAHFFYIATVIFLLVHYMPRNSMHTLASIDEQLQIPTYESYAGDVESYLASHPIREAEQDTFGVMGMFTRIYARMLQDPHINSFFLEQYEKSLWYFLPGIKSIRESALKSKSSKRGSRVILLSAYRDRFDICHHFINVIRKTYQSDIPIQLAFIDDNDFPPEMQENFVSSYTDVSILNLSLTTSINVTEAGISSWAAKVFALVATEYDEILLADLDTILLAPPEDFFRDPGYLRTGTLFFSDRQFQVPHEDKHNWLKKQLGSYGPSKSLRESTFWQFMAPHRQESGIVVINKSKPHVFAALLFIAWENLKAIREKITWTIFYGEKESYWLAFEIARLPYYMVNHGAGHLGVSKDIIQEGPLFCAPHPLHFFEVPPGQQIADDMIESPPTPLYNSNLSRPAWFNGSFRSDKMQSPSLLNVSDVQWTMDGYYEGGCLKNYTMHGTDRFQLKSTLERIEVAVKEANTYTEAFIASHQAT